MNYKWILDPDEGDEMHGSGEQPHLSTAMAAKFATAAYRFGDSYDPRRSTKEEATELIRQMLDGSGFAFVDNRSERQLSVFYNPETSHLHVAHTGTQQGHKDMWTDIKSDTYLMVGAQGFNTEQFVHRKKKTESHYLFFKPKIFTMSGHSLGGATVIDALQKSKILNKAIDQADTFNAGVSPFGPWEHIWNTGMKYFNVKESREQTKRSNKLKEVLTHHRISGDPISAIGFNSPTRGIEGEKRRYDYREVVPPERQKTFKEDPIDPHKLEYFINEDDPMYRKDMYRSSDYPARLVSERKARNKKERQSSAIDFPGEEAAAEEPTEEPESRKRSSPTSVGFFPDFTGEEAEQEPTRKRPRTRSEGPAENEGLFAMEDAYNQLNKQEKELFKEFVLEST